MNLMLFFSFENFEAVNQIKYKLKKLQKKDKRKQQSKFFAAISVHRNEEEIVRNALTAQILVIKNDGFDLFILFC